MRIRSSSKRIRKGRNVVTRHSLCKRHGDTRCGRCGSYHKKNGLTSVSRGRFAGAEGY